MYGIRMLYQSYNHHTQSCSRWCYIPMVLKSLCDFKGIGSPYKQLFLTKFKLMLCRQVSGDKRAI